MSAVVVRWYTHGRDSPPIPFVSTGTCTRTPTPRRQLCTGTYISQSIFVSPYCKKLRLLYGIQHEITGSHWSAEFFGAAYLTVSRRNGGVGVDRLPCTWQHANRLEVVVWCRGMRRWPNRPVIRRHCRQAYRSIEDLQSRRQLRDRVAVMGIAERTDLR
jgi:hypothetical protein